MDFRRTLTLTLLLSVCATAHATNHQKKQASVARCFFVFAPILEHAKLIKNEALESYAMQRILYIRGFMENLTDDPNFKFVFESNLSKNRTAGILLSDALNTATKNNDNAAFNQELRKGEDCDKELGIKTK